MEFSQLGGTKKQKNFQRERDSLSIGPAAGALHHRLFWGGIGIKTVWFQSGTGL